VTIWLDAQLSPAIAPWIEAAFGLDVHSVRDLGMRDAEDLNIYTAAHAAGAVVMTKDRDFVLLHDRLGPPPRVIWQRCWNTSNARLRQILSATFADAFELLESGESLVEIAAA
jgi:predicted nuclease of predicted toxin-antitoxin system